MIVVRYINHDVTLCIHDVIDVPYTGCRCSLDPY